MPMIPDWSEERRAQERANYQARKQANFQAVAERQSLFDRQQKEFQRMADDFARQQGIEPSKVQMIVCRRGARQ